MFCCWKNSEKCISISTYMPSIGLANLKVDFWILRNHKLFIMVKTNSRVQNVKQYVYFCLKPIQSNHQPFCPIEITVSVNLSKPRALFHLSFKVPGTVPIGTEPWLPYCHDTKLKKFWNSKKVLKSNLSPQMLILTTTSDEWISFHDLTASCATKKK